MTSPEISPPPSALRGPLVGLARAAARGARKRPKTIIALWLLLVIGCVAAGSLVGSKSLTDLQSEVGESRQADELIQKAALADPASENILITAPTAAQAGAALSDLTVRVSALPQVSVVTGPAQAPALSVDGGRVVLVQATLRGDPAAGDEHVEPLLQTVAAVQRTHPGARLAETGGASQSKAIGELIDADLRRAERISLPITLVILVLAFGALVAASVPLLLGLTSVAATLGALGLVSQLVPNSDSTASVVAVIGLAFGVDYSLFYVRREREERRRGRPHLRGAQANAQESALEAAAASVGRAILVSGVIVMIALAGLLITGQADFVSMGLGTILVVLIAVAGSLTVLPAVLALLGDKVDRGRIPGHRWIVGRRTGREQAAGRRLGPWAGVARTVTASPVAWLVASVCLLAALAVPLTGMRTADLTLDDLPPNLASAQAARSIEHYFPGTAQNAQLVVRGHDLGSPAARRELIQLGRRARPVTGGTGTVNVTVSRDGSLARVDVPMPERDATTQKGVVTRLRREVAPTATSIPGVGQKALVTGSAADGLDYSQRVARATPVVIAFVLALGFLLLVATFRAPMLAAAVMGLNLLSIGSAYGILTAVFQHTWAEDLLHFHSSGHIISWMPLFMFVILFGLSMDYTILVLERIREARLAGLRPREAAAEGVAATAGTVTSAAVVMVAVFAIFATLQVITFKQLGVGLAAAVLLDATLVRAVALPAVVSLLGERGWPVRRPTGRGPDRASAAGAPRWDDASVSTRSGVQ